MRSGGEKAKPQLRGTVPEQVSAMTAGWPESAWSANPGVPQKVQEGCVYRSSMGWVGMLAVRVGVKDASVYRVLLALGIRWVDFLSSEMLRCYQLGLSGSSSFREMLNELRESRKGEV